MTLYTEVAGPLGALLLTASDDTLTGCYFTTPHHPPPQLDWQQEDSTALFREAAAQLQSYFARELRAFALPLAPIGTPFQQTVWQELQKIPYGQTISYGEGIAHANDHRPDSSPPPPPKPTIRRPRTAIAVPFASLRPLTNRRQSL